ncbi:hypothetical protein [Paucisalibacillus globulus]|uniref:hypothetical protein n=1 Tax=Paucisalibacillus globulus TaxID=351095 RepID=UPI001596506B|nr:hypothetical protein [Paucisalibacillus globulus]
MANKKTEEVASFTKQQLLKSKKYAHRQDALNALLKDDKSYSFDEVDKILDKFYKGGSK